MSTTAPANVEESAPQPPRKKRKTIEGAELIDEVPSKPTSEEPQQKPLYCLADFPTSGDFLLMLLKKNVMTLIPQPDVIVTVRGDDKLPTVFKRLVDKNILSAPVYDKGRFIGFIDMLDLVATTVELFSTRPGFNSTMSHIANCFQEEERFQNMTVKEVLKKLHRPQSMRNPFYPVHKSFSTCYAIESLARLGLHRIPLVDDDQRCIGILTQSMLIDFLYQNIEQLGAKRHLPVAMMKTSPVVVTVRRTSQAIAAFQQMVEKHVSGVAVVDEKGFLTGNISIRDLKGIGPDASLFWRLFQPVESFQLKVSQEYQKTPVHVIYATLADTLETVLAKLKQHRIHRVYVVASEEDKRPIGVISLGDVLRNVFLF